MQDIPFAWKMRLSKRAKRPRITINVHGGVELVWPYKMSQRYASKMLHTHTAWVLKHLKTSENKPEQVVSLPTEINFPAINQVWLVKYESKEGRLRVVEENENLVVCGDFEDKENLREILKRWVKKQAKAHFHILLAEVANEMGLTYQSVSIRLQKKRWGSCSAKGNISLNAALLFLPDFLVKHVFIHELAHLKHLNHSSAFWAEVEKFEPEYQQNRRLLKQYAKNVPAWLTEPLLGELA